MTGIFDSHSHYDDDAFCGETRRFKLCENGARGEDRDSLIADVFRRGVSAVMSCGTTIESSRANLKLAQKHENLYFAAGVHPECVMDCPEDYLTSLRELLAHPKAKAVGEIGLDYSYEIPREPQKRIFREQIELAKELDLPVIVHDRDAHGDTFDLLTQIRPRGVLHCYSGSPEMAAEYLKAGFYLGVTGIVTFKNARKVPEIVAQMPLDRLLIETDAPYLAPVPYRGCRNDSSLLFPVAETIAAIRGVSTQEIIDATYQNACTLFNIK